MTDSERLQLRADLQNVYFSESWWERVDKMSDAQLFTVHTKFTNEGKIIK